jgi:hypothetical protein
VPINVDNQYLGSRASFKGSLWRRVNRALARVTDVRFQEKYASSQRTRHEKSARRRFFAVLAEQAGFEPAVGY